MNSKVKAKTTAENSSSVKTYWNKREKLRLLKALKNNDHTDVLNISNRVATKSPREVEVMINKLITKAQNVKEDRKPLINDWLECESFKKASKKNLLIRQALIFIYLFERHSTSANNKYDYRAIYHFLYKLFCGYKEPEISKENGQLLYELLAEITKQTISIPQKDITITLEKLLDKKANKRTYLGKTKS